MAETFLILFLALAALLLLAYMFHPGFRAQVDADTAGRRKRRPHAHRADPDPLADAELWPDSPADPRAFDRWFAAHGDSKDPRPPADSRD